MRPTDPAVRRALAVARGPLAVVVALGVVGALLLVAQAWLVTELILAALRGSGVLPWALAVVGLFLARAVVGWAGDVAAARSAVRVGAGVRRSVVLGALAGRVPGSSGAVTALATRGAAATEPYLTRYVPALVLAGVLPLLVVVAIAVLDPLSALIVLATLPLIPVFGILVGLATRDRAESQWRALADLAGHFLDVMRGLPTLVAFRRARAQSSVIAAVTDRYRVRTLATLRIAFASSAVLELVATLSVALVAVTVGLRLASGSMGLETALIVLLLAPEAYWPLRKVGAEFHAAAEGAATFAQISGEQPQTDTSNPGEQPQTDTSNPGERSQTDITVVEASLTYPGRLVPALAPVSLSVPAHGVTAVVGPSGCGKSTLLAVLAGLREPSSGYVVGPARDQIALLPQRPVFVAGTVADNLRLARPSAADQELWRVLDSVRLTGRIADLDAPLGEDGLSLSAGERARLVLARVILSERPWVLLDEPTAHLDQATEQVIVEVVAELGRTRGVVLVAHKPALVDLADQIVELSPPASRSAPVSGCVGSPRSERQFGTAHHAPGRQFGTAHRDSAVSLGPVAGRGRGGLGLGLGLATLLGGLASTSGVALTATAGWLIVRASEGPGVLMLMVAIVGVRTFGIARPALRYVERLRSHDAALRLLAERRVQVYDAVVPLTPGRLGKRRGDVLAAVVDDVDAVLDRELRVRLPVRSFLVTAAIAIAVSSLLEPRAGLIVAAVCAAGAVAYLLARTGARQAQATAVATRALVSERVADAVQAADELRMWGAEPATIARIEAADDGSAQVTSARWLGAARAVTLLAAGAGVTAMAATMATTATGPILALLVLTPLALAEPLASLADAGATAARAEAAERRLHELEATPPAVTDPATAKSAEGTVIELHRPKVRQVLDDLDLTVAEGEHVAVVGPSGSGKSTLASLLLRFTDPDEGTVSLGGVRMTEQRADDVREHVGLVDDDPHVFASTVAENVRFARPGADDDEVRRALARAHLDQWLDDLPEGIDTRLGDGYAQISGGERARLAIARSLLADQRVLVLDEPTAHLDAATAAALAREVMEEEDRSVVWITHGTAGLDLADRLVTLERT
ncbi:thiol reductant ABC exporter subunit CydD [Nocardioides sp.]|uniref:thiol reductant ABC exporter subunit CydD n=1 Tax=Nocardioides sp. TaxID=35761 RepID=UPI0039E37586